VKLENRTKNDVRLISLRFRYWLRWILTIMSHFIRWLCLPANTIFVRHIDISAKHMLCLWFFLFNIRRWECYSLTREYIWVSLPMGTSLKAFYPIGGPRWISISYQLSFSSEKTENSNFFWFSAKGETAGSGTANTCRVLESSKIEYYIFFSPYILICLQSRIIVTLDVTYSSECNDEVNGTSIDSPSRCIVHYREWASSNVMWKRSTCIIANSPE
jgi:hypothetical protein